MSSIRAELIRALTRGNLALLALMTALVAFAMVKAGPQGHPAVQGFKDASIFLATFLMGRAATTAASDYRAGTLRTWLISQPSRMITYAGKLAASLAVACIGGLVLIGVAWGLSALLGPPVAAAPAATMTGQFLLACVSLTLFGHAAGILTRSVPAALTITLGWILPAEAVLSGSVTQPDHWLPGLLLRSVTDGVTPAGMTAPTVIAHALVPFLILEAIALVTFFRRDATC